MSRCDGGLRSGIQACLKYKTNRKFGALIVDSGDSGWLDWYDQRGVKCFVEP